MHSPGRGSSLRTCGGAYLTNTHVNAPAPPPLRKGPTLNGPAIDPAYNAESDKLGRVSDPAETKAGDRPPAIGHKAIEEPPSTVSTGTGGAE